MASWPTALSRDRLATNLRKRSTDRSLRAISLLPRPEHHIRIHWETESSDVNLARKPLFFLKLAIISRHDDIGKQHLGFVDPQRIVRG